ncbi:MAG: hypothetical protein CME71_01835 [Halobacteriovorax sp.]|nr:hypothetical protein [Halobacteriovorax sp.]|tara:strand:- start:1090 stop:1464 length:375 start_codon:yes stop_codon:yes gene_type:complete
MKKLLIATLAFTFLTGASWLDLEVDHSVELNQKIDLIATDGAPYVLPAGTKLRFVESMKLVLNAWLYIFEQESCTDLGRSTELELLAHTTEEYEYGVELDDNCMVNVFLVTQDLYKEPIVTKSL